MVYKNELTRKNIDDFVIHYTGKVEKKIHICKNVEKIKDDDLIIPDVKNYSVLLHYNYNVNQLKIFAKHHKLKITGTKPQLLLRVFTYLYLSKYIVILQKYVRGKLLRKYNELHGPGFIKRDLCVNTEDFVSLQSIKSIDFHQFITFKDTDGFVYGCDIASLYTLIHQNIGKPYVNPYNRSIIPNNIYNKIKRIIKLSIIFNKKVKLFLEDEKDETIESLPVKKQLELKCLALFQSIDSLGNYSNPEWFLTLNKEGLMKFMRELIDIWNYRSQLLPIVRRQICPPNGDPFSNLNVSEIYSLQDLDKIKMKILEPLEKMVYNGIDSGSKSLGAIYVLSALTLVNTNAADSLPWLYQSVNYA
jgi:hypothetical protein